jgi:hypothetical protein
VNANPTGEDLYEELRAAAAAAGISLHKFAAPLFGEPNWKLQQLRIAKAPKPLTIARVRALIAGEPVPQPVPSPKRGIPRGDETHRVNDGESRLNGDEIARRRALAESAAAMRAPGETIADAVRRVRAQQQSIAALGGQQ